MLEIEAGEYARDTDGIIVKVQGKLGDEYVIKPFKGKMYTLTYKQLTKDIVNHSKDIRELIDLDDYVAIEDEVLPFEYVWQIIERDGKWKINNFEDVKAEDIKAIVTKERFLSEVYKF